jgi:hypothetical protein
LNLSPQQADEKRPSAALPSSLVIATYCMYDSFLGISGALHLNIFHQPVQILFWTDCYDNAHYATQPRVAFGMPNV